jgi:hypothetical protein
MTKRLFPLLALLILLAGCDAFSRRERVASPEMFDAAGMRIHPIFTQIKDWTGDGEPDGIEALIEVTDQFGDPAKAGGQVLFELFAYRDRNPDPRGQRLANPWIGALATVQDQQAHWNNTTQTYNFQLAAPRLATDRTYVLTATFETNTGKRFFDRIILTPSAAEKESAVGQPSTRPVR